MFAIISFVFFFFLHALRLSAAYRTPTLTRFHFPGILSFHIYLQ